LLAIKDSVREVLEVGKAIRREREVADRENRPPSNWAVKNVRQNYPNTFRYVRSIANDPNDRDLKAKHCRSLIEAAGKLWTKHLKAKY
jgi:hypothetical protein